MIGLKKINDEEYYKLLDENEDNWTSPVTMQDPGVYVVSRKKTPLYCGHMIFMSEDDDYVLMVSGPEDHVYRWKWEGSLRDYKNLWERNV